MNNLLRTLLFLFLLLILIVLTFAAGFFTNQYLLNKKGVLPTLSVNNLNSTQADPFFTSHTASIQGKVTNINGNKLTIENNKGVTNELKLEPNFQIYIPDPSGRMSTPSADLKLIKLNTDVSISAVSINGEFQVTTLHY